MAHEKTEPLHPSQARRWIALLLLVAAMLAVAFYGLTTYNQTQRLAGARVASSLGMRTPQNAAILRTFSDEDVERVLSANPLYQRTLNVAMARHAGRGDSYEPWIAQTSRLGWRDTAALQNLIYTAAQREDFTAILNISEALMRRQQLMDRVIPLLAVMEQEPNLRSALVERLAPVPELRLSYLPNTDILREPIQLSARYQLIDSLQRAGIELSWAELANNIRALAAAKDYDRAFALFTMARPGTSRPLADTGFLQATTDKAANADPVAFEWQTMTGEGYNASTYMQDGDALLEIRWNGRGVPVFVRQRSTAEPGSYALQIDGTAAQLRPLSAFSFRLVCEEAAIPFRRIESEAGLASFVTARPVPCSYPLFEVVGAVQSSRETFDLIISSIAMTRIASQGANGG